MYENLGGRPRPPCPPLPPPWTATYLNVEAMANRLERCVRFGWLRIWALDLLYMRHKRSR